jgi:hypothetical protein
VGKKQYTDDYERLSYVQDLLHKTKLRQN